MTVDRGTAAFISLGSNIGDKRGYCQKGIDGLRAAPRTTITALSRFYRTEPVDYKDQDWFVNGVVRIDTELDPYALLDLLHTIEQAAGRERKGVRFGPRTLDMDIILYGNWVVNTPTLSIPHPRMHKRRFVLQPLCDIDPTVVHPVFLKNAQYLLEHLDDEGQKMFPCEESETVLF
ncbi:MAG: 2-amino-4-hydroxy-6-hydroxymethyldihydropteridine diphosphokinase [Desulfococcus multivorans]|jgi:2-amino-4-hydroxy-6-hydroxymethyldihydropteridine diphosphokinase|uniref:2-amino-4-hydroxy-6- hydroxymethyldihydropteridine diphosphokinase n=1 Tax=Desulfococcus sp. TaxID=2025834 RepID=UPI002A37BDFE|nr:2-amino-4-hydroxy-6-hydroxymethyldihydropteridine diphosphokinase [Desulfococcus multivorans]